jgi:DNA polymerase/3'-5' exonuclease PolX
MRMLGSSEVAKLLHEFGQRTAFRGGNPYRARAYTRAAENLLTLVSRAGAWKWREKAACLRSG